MSIGIERGGLSASPHAVQFYEDEGFLFDIVGDFLADGLMAGEPAVVIATPSHRDGFTHRLRSRGFVLDESCITFLDARDTLALFMKGDAPDESAFVAAVGGVLEKAGSGRGEPVRAYGEMVDLLWRDGNPEAALRLEELWNKLKDRHNFSLLCAYPMANFDRESDGALLEDVCNRHTHVTPTERYIGAADRNQEIALLQQRATALQAEIEHRKVLEKALREALVAQGRAERDLKDFCENATVGLHRVGPDGTILWANDAELRLLGYSADEYVGHHIARFYADPDVIDDILKTLTAGGEIRDREARLRAKDGSVRHVSISSNALFEDGKFIHTRCFTRDITLRKRLEEEEAFLLEATTVLVSSLDYQSRLAALSDLVVPKLADWCAIDVAIDGTYERTWITHRDPERATLVEQLIEQLRLDPAMDPVAKALHSGESMLSADPSRGLSSCSNVQISTIESLELRSWIVVPLKVGDRVLGALTLATTSSSNRRFSEESLPLVAELARRAAIAIENARLYQIAQQANRTKDEFLATLSHELRTPLTAILGWARLLTLGGLDEEVTRTAVETIERSARTQATLIDDLLDLSKIVTGKLTLNHELVDLRGVIESAVSTVRLAADAKRIQIQVDPPSERLVVTGDATRLQQIVWNLLSNAVKFSKPEATVLVSAACEGGKVKIAVEDSGRGISAQFLPHVFEPFRQADGATTRSHGGLGLGLAIVKYLAELHGGTVKAFSRGEGTGATFTVRLPIAVHRPESVESGLFDEPIDLTGTLVLVIDDDDDVRHVVTTMLQSCGASVVAVESVMSARASLDQRRPDIVITDVAMPERDGFELLQYIRSAPALRMIRVVALTALAQPDKAAGFDACLAKPIEPQVLARAIHNVVRATPAA